MQFNPTGMRFVTQKKESLPKLSETKFDIFLLYINSF